MFNRVALATALIGSLAALTGCSGGDALRVGINLSRDDSNIKVWIDGYEAKQNKLKKGWGGYAKFKIGEQVSPSPTLRFEFDKPEKFGRIMTVSLQIHQAFESDYSHQAEFVVFPAAGKEDRENQLKDKVEYNLGALGPHYKVFDVYGKEIPGVKMEPGKKYLMVLTVNADKSESMQIFFEVGANAKPAAKAEAKAEATTEEKK
ncbi:MAG: hypothetical protein JNG88_12930 [Phycisphaerales bacterium]|nr:hypothetical protein [Phycisphaerales bacterium]